MKILFIYNAVFTICSALLSTGLLCSQLDIGFSGKFVDYFQCIGIGEMDVADRIFDTSRELTYKSRITIRDTNIKYPQYTNAIWTPGKSEQGYWPGKFQENKIVLCKMEDVVFTTECVILKPNGYHLFKHACHPRYWGIGLPYHNPHVTFEKYNQVICIGHQHSSDWGHWFLEVFPGLIALPEEILRESLIALPFARDFVVNNLESIGIDRSQLIVGDNKAYFAHTFITIESTWCGDLNRFLIVNMKTHYYKLYNLSPIKPVRYVLFNRPKGMARHIENYDELMQATKEKFSTVNWESGQENKCIADAARYFASIKLLFAVHGSILANEIFMKEGTVVCELQMETWLLSFIFLGPMTGINQIEGRDSSISYRDKKGNMIDINYAIRMIVRGMNMLL